MKSDNVNAEIIAVGTEILLGEITDTNSVYLAQQLRNLGVNVYFMTSVGDNVSRIAQAVQIALERADVVIMCGGLGPTVDDMTRQGVAEAIQQELVFYEELHQHIVRRFEMYRVTMTENNKRQAYLPATARPVHNPVGTAPGFMVERGDKTVISLPGVPHEMKFLMQETVIPYLRQKYRLGLIKARILRVAGIGESSLDDKIGDDLLKNNNPTVGLAAHHGVIDIRITAKADTESEADVMLDDMEQVLRERIGAFVFGYGDDRLEEVLVGLLRDHQRQITVIEAGIDGAVLTKLRATEHGSGILYDAQQFTHPSRLLNGRTSLRETAIQLSEEQVQQSDCAACIVILSLPDIDEVPDVDEATAVAVATAQKTTSRIYGSGGQSELFRDRVSRWAIAVTWRLLKDLFEQSR